MSKRVRRLGLGLWIVAGLAVAGCGGDDGGSGPSHPSIEGHWSGTVNPGGTLVLNLAEDDGNVTGTGTLTATGLGLAIDVTGTYTRSTADASLTLSSEGFEPMNLNGTVTETKIVGALNGSGFQDAAISLTRQ